MISGYFKGSHMRNISTSVFLAVVMSKHNIFTPFL